MMNANNMIMTLFDIIVHCYDHIEQQARGNDTKSSKQNNLNWTQTCNIL